MRARGNVRTGIAVVVTFWVLAAAAGAATVVARRIIVDTGRARDITSTSAMVAGSIGAARSARYSFAFGRTRSYGRRTTWKLARSGQRRILAGARLGSLTPATTYHYRLVAAACRGCRRVYGSDRTFVTAPRAGTAAPPPPPPAPASLPGAHTGAADQIGQGSARLTGEVNPQHASTTYRFAYGPTDAYGALTPGQPAGAGDSPIRVTADLSGLAHAAAYHYRLVATSSAGTAYGADETFTTEGSYQNPVYLPSFPDPFVLDDGNRHSDYWAFGTGEKFGVLHSTDLVHWTAQGTALTARPGWVVSSGDWHPWSPGVIHGDGPCPGSTSDGCYVMYYVGLSAQLGLNCIGVATSPTPGGPYSDQGPLTLSSASGPVTMPLGCGDAQGKGNIDPSPFLSSSGQAYLYVSTDRSCTGGSCVLKPTISVIPLSSDLMHASGSRVALLTGDPGSWEDVGVQAPTVEGPSLELHDGIYYLLYSGGSWQEAYGMGYATSSSPTGPFAKSASNPILAETSAVYSPGGGDTLVTGPHGGLWMVYAARSLSYATPRTLRLDPFSWEPGNSAGAPDVPVIGGPTATPQATEP